MKIKSQPESTNVEFGPGNLLSSNEIGRPMLVVLVLLVALLISSVSVIYQAYEYRQLFNTQQQLVTQWDDLQVEWGQLLLEQSALGANSRVEQKAKEQLSMQVPKPENVEMISYE
ncbi:MAG: cell division protein FtsL [Oceanospirillaceae bacterium]|nr:cell division protein FtsL [Oceanospirillaceae bacterium]